MCVLNHDVVVEMAVDRSVRIVLHDNFAVSVRMSRPTFTRGAAPVDFSTGTLNAWCVRS